MLGGEEKEEDPDAAKKEEERQEALRQQEEERKGKYAKMEAEREQMRQGIRDKVEWQMSGLCLSADTRCHYQRKDKNNQQLYIYIYKYNIYDIQR